MTASSYLAAILAPAAVLAGPPKTPGPTPAVSPDPIQGFSPKITGAARVEDAAIELLKRYVDYDQTCGFVDGDLASALTCSGVDICATNSILGVAGCCNPLSLDSCYLFTSCVAASQLSSCTASSCLLNDAVAKCTDSTAPYCVDWDYDFITTTMKAYGCDVSDFTGTVERTYSGQDTYDISSYLTSVAEFSFPTVFVTQTQIVSAGLTSGTAASSHGSATEKKSHLGAIVGGVIGGLAALVLLAVVVIFILFKKRRNRKRAAAAASAAAFQQNQQQPPPPPPMAYGPPGGPGPNDYKPPPMGVPRPQQQQQQQQYGAPPPQMQQPGNTMSFYAPPPPPAAQSGDVKHEYSQQSVSSVPGTPGPYSPPLSPSPQYSPPAGQPHQQQQWNPNVPQIDGTPVHMNSEGNRIHEAP